MKENQPDDTTELPPFDQLVEGAIYQIPQEEGSSNLIPAECGSKSTDFATFNAVEEEASYALDPRGWNMLREDVSSF